MFASIPQRQRMAHWVMAVHWLAPWTPGRGSLGGAAGAARGRAALVLGRERQPATATVGHGARVRPALSGGGRSAGACGWRALACDSGVAAASENLVALVLYGGLARGRYRGPKRDIDLAGVLEDASTERVCLLTPVLLAAWRAARVEPWIIARAELGQLAEIFPTKVLDISEHHLMLAGEDVFSAVRVDARHLRFRVEQELTNLSLRLRRHQVSLADDPASMAVYLVGIARPLAIQLAALLRVAGRELPAEDRSAAIFAQAAAEFGLDAEALAALAGLREGESPAEDVSGIFGRVHASATRAAEVTAALQVPA
jgi:hypothetical protein